MVPLFIGISLVCGRFRHTTVVDTTVTATALHGSAMSLKYLSVRPIRDFKLNEACRSSVY
jgi:hypothetical protein